MPKANIDAPVDSSTASTDINLDADTSHEELVEAVTTLADEMADLRQANERLRDETVYTVVVERVLLEYGISGEQLDGIIEDIEAVDSQLRGENDE